MSHEQAIHEEVVKSAQYQMVLYQGLLCYCFKYFVKYWFDDTAGVEMRLRGREFLA
jgi:type IV secretory pathway TrbD component